MSSPGDPIRGAKDFLLQQKDEARKDAMEEARIKAERRAAAITSRTGRMVRIIPRSAMFDTGDVYRVEGEVSSGYVQP